MVDFNVNHEEYFFFPSAIDDDNGVRMTVASLTAFRNIPSSWITFEFNNEVDSEMHHEVDFKVKDEEGFFRRPWMMPPLS